MKRMISLSLLATLVLTLCACGQKPAETVTVNTALEPAVLQEISTTNQQSAPAEARDPR